MADNVLTLGLSTHRPETVPFAEILMAGNQAVILEEPVTPGFTDMLDRRMHVDDYILGADYEFPEHARALYPGLQRLHDKGVAVMQVDPYMDVLIRIHEFFADGGRPSEIKSNTEDKTVYNAERAWSAMLMDYYAKSLTEPFEVVVEAVKNFARADAARGRVRDFMRVEAIRKIVPPYKRVYVEAGYIHYALLLGLKKNLPLGWKTKPVWLLESVARNLAGKRQILGPGDVLTLLYTCRPDFEGTKADLLAARSLVYIKILGKNEIKGQDHPHIKDEAVCAAMVSNLDTTQCEHLFTRIRTLPTPKAVKAVKKFLEG